MLAVSFAFVLASTSRVAFDDASSKIQPVSWMDVKIHDNFWSPRQKTLITHTLREQFEQLDANKYRQNFERAAKREHGGYVGYVFNDSDVYKVIEAASYALGIQHDAWLDKTVDDWIDLIGRAQEPDGYLDCHFQLDEPQNKWKNLRDQHEMYCAGHLFEAAVAHYKATGKTTLLTIAKKLADHMDARFGPGKHMGYPGHPEAELGLMKLWRATGEKRYFDLSAFFLNNRGSKWFATEHNTPLDEYNGEYWSDNLPIRDHESIIGHAVRAAYLFCGATDLAEETQDRPLMNMLDRVWASTTEKRMFVTGGIGPSGSNEGFTVDYDLPTFSAYQETCASVANAFWNYRMTLLHGDGKYADVMEQAMYNGALAGINYAGDKYYYVNPLASHGNHHRQDWFGCACCPPNIARMIGQLGGLSYAQSNDSAYVMLYVGSSANLKVGGKPVELDVNTKYPYSGSVAITVNPTTSQNFNLKLRSPEWAGGLAKLTVNGKSVDAVANNGFVSIRREWKKGDSVRFEIPMSVRRVISHPSVKDTFGMVALARGPLVYCLESVDNPFDMDRAGFPINSAIAAKTEKGLFGDTTVLEGEAFVTNEQSWNDRLFATVGTTKPVKFRAIPYCFWDNRKAGEMRVWLSPSPAPAPLRGLEKDAKVTVSFKNSNSDPTGANDGYVPEGSNPNSPKQLHFWSHKGGTEWVQYSFAKPVTASSTRVYWFDDSGRGECRVPKAWRLEAKINGDWMPVQLADHEKFGLTLNAWNDVKFKAVTSQEFRLMIDQQDKWASGIHEWQLFGQ